MIVGLVFVPPGGGETDYSLQFKMPGVPQVGDYVSVRREGQDPNDGPGTIDFIVRRTWWHLNYPNMDLYGRQPAVHGSTADVIVECEFAVGHTSSNAHKRACKMYADRGMPLKSFEATAF